jgi:hypothetical protein
MIFFMALGHLHIRCEMGEIYFAVVESLGCVSEGQP